MKFEMKQHNTPGILITFCGLDGCGKSTQIRLLNEYLMGIGLQPILTKQPTDEVRNMKAFRTYMDSSSHEQYAYRSLSLVCAGDRVQHSEKVILPLLEKGEVVISDRYFYSCLANLRARGYKEDRWIYEVASFIPKPDLAFFLDVNVQTAVRRVRSRKEEQDRYIDMELQRRLREEYIAIAQTVGGIVLSTHLEPIQCAEMIREVVLKKIAHNTKQGRKECIGC